jgi:hypothetical protein
MERETTPKNEPERGGWHAGGTGKWRIAVSGP